MSNMLVQEAMADTFDGERDALSSRSMQAKDEAARAKTNQRKAGLASRDANKRLKKATDERQVSMKAYNSLDLTRIKICM